MIEFLAFILGLSILAYIAYVVKDLSNIESLS